MNTDQNDSSPGRKTVMTDEVVQKLTKALERGLSVTLACQYAHISRRTFYKWSEENEEFMRRMEDARLFVTLVASEVVANEILDKRNVRVAMWWLERKDQAEFGMKTKQEIIVTDRPEYKKTPLEDVKTEFDRLFGIGEDTSPKN